MKVVYLTIFTLLFSVAATNAQDHRREGGVVAQRENRSPNGFGNQNGSRNERRSGIQSQGNHQNFGGNRRNEGIRPNISQNQNRPSQGQNRFDNDRGNYAVRPNGNGSSSSNTLSPNRPSQGQNHFDNDRGNLTNRPNTNGTINNQNYNRPNLNNNGRRDPIYIPNNGNNYSYGRPIQNIDHHRYSNYRYNNIYFYGNNGIYYRPWNNGYIRFSPPIGFSINILPFGAITINIGNRPAYFYEGIYYQKYNNGYQVIKPPIGTYVYALPSGYERVEYYNQLYYEFAGILYEKVYYQGENMYQVVGYLG